MSSLIEAVSSFGRQTEQQAEQQAEVVGAIIRTSRVI